MKLTMLRRNRIKSKGAAPGEGRSKRRRGQSLIELALLLPLLVMLLSVVVEGGLAFNAWLRVGTAARDGTRFALDQGRPGDTVNLILYKLKGVDFGSSREISGSLNIDIFRIQGATNGSGQIPNNSAHWKKDQLYNGDSSSGDTPRVTRTGIQARLQQASGASAANIPFIIVEVDFRYTPVLASLIAPGAQLPMTSYAIIQQEPNN